MMMNAKLQLRLIFDNGLTFGPGKADLLDLIARLGSISAAGREMRMSYKRAWGLVEEMNHAFQSPLVTAERGGAGHGGARVTEAGLAVLARYRRLQAAAQSTGAAEIAAIAEALADPAPLPKADATDMFDKT
jgi:molybdate transport system regulatory protein